MYDALSQTASKRPVNGLGLSLLTSHSSLYGGREEGRSVHSNKGRGKGYGRQQILHLQSKERLHYKLNYKVDKKKQVLYSVFCLGKLHAAL